MDVGQFDGLQVPTVIANWKVSMHICGSLHKGNGYWYLRASQNTEPELQDGIRHTPYSCCHLEWWVRGGFKDMLSRLNVGHRHSEKSPYLW